MTDKPITERLLERLYRVQQSGADSWRWAVMLGADVVLKRTRQSDAQAEADRLNDEHQVKVFAEAQEAAFREGYLKCAQLSQGIDNIFNAFDGDWLASDTRKELVEGGAE